MLLRAVGVFVDEDERTSVARRAWIGVGLAVVAAAIAVFIVKARRHDATFVTGIAAVSDTQAVVVRAVPRGSSLELLEAGRGARWTRTLDARLPGWFHDTRPNVWVSPERGRVIARLEPRAFGFRLAAFDLATGAPAWQSEPFGSGDLEAITSVKILVAGDAAIAMHWSTGKDAALDVAAFDVVAGAPRWRTRLAGTWGSVETRTRGASLVVMDAIGSVAVLDLASGAVKKQIRTEPFLPCVLDDVVEYVGDDHRLHSLTIATGEEGASLALPEPSLASNGECGRRAERRWVMLHEIHRGDDVLVEHDARLSSLTRTISLQLSGLAQSELVERAPLSDEAARFVLVAGGEEHAELRVVDLDEGRIVRRVDHPPGGAAHFAALRSHGGRDRQYAIMKAKRPVLAAFDGAAGSLLAAVDVPAASALQPDLAFGPDTVWITDGAHVGVLDGATLRLGWSDGPMTVADAREVTAPLFAR